MSDHVRKQLRAAAVTALTNLVSTSGRVYEGRVHPLPTEQASLLVDIGGERISASTRGGASRVNERDLELEVRAVVKGTSYLAALDAIVLEVEEAIAANQSLGGLAKWVQPTEYDRPEIDGNGDKTAAVQTMRFQITYYAALNAPTVAL